MTDTRTIIEMTEGSEEDRMFEGAFNSVLHMDKKDYPSYVGGIKVASGHDFVVSSPIDESIRFGNFQEPEDDLARHAVAAAEKAFGPWSKTDVEKRACIFEMVLDNIKRQRFRMAAMVLLSSGMTRARAVEEVDRLIEVIGREIRNIRSAKKGKAGGVWAIISEHNSPLTAPIGYAVAAMLAGNTVIMTPSRFCPVPVYMVYDMMKAAMLPDGVINIIVDRRGKVTDSLTESEGIAGIVAIGSGKRMEEMMFLQIDDKIGFVNEVKGMNPVLVSRPHNMTQTASAILKSAFSFAGQDLNAPSKAVIMADEQKAFIEAILKAAADLQVGDPAERTTTLGPIISKEQMELFLHVVDSFRDNVIFGGKRIMNAETECGYYVMPAIVTGMSMDSDINNIDQTVPILSIQTAGDIEEALEMVNCCDVGRMSGIYTKDEKLAQRFAEESPAEIVYVNDIRSVPMSAFRADITEFMD